MAEEEVLTDIPHIHETTDNHQRPPTDAGTLVLMGGSLTPDGEAFGRFLDETHARKGGRVIVLTLASSEPAEAAKYWREVFQLHSATGVVFPQFTRDDEALDHSLAEMVESAQGVFLTGGDQVALVAALSGTATCAAIKSYYADGGVIGGTSAGAAALTELTMAGGEIDAEGNLVEQYIGPGLGLLGHNAIIDTHFSERRRLKRLFFVVAANTHVFGIGIDEDTGLVVQNGIGEVVGAGGVTFVDGRNSVRFDNAHDLEAGRQLTLSHLRVGIIGTHYHLNLIERDLHEITRVRAHA